MMISYTPEELNELLFVIGGAATQPLLEDHPDYVFPSERVKFNIQRVMKEWNIPITEGHNG